MIMFDVCDDEHNFYKEYTVTGNAETKHANQVGERQVRK